MGAGARRVFSGKYVSATMNVWGRRGAGCVVRFSHPVLLAHAYLPLYCVVRVFYRVSSLDLDIPPRRKAHEFFVVAVVCVCMRVGS